MPGKAYTMREMKQIVDHLVEHKLYHEIKGRKMWMDFANSLQMKRTWQSLKETFLKRILPDIQNPYYKLSVLQIASFKQGYDSERKETPQLEIYISDDSNGSGSNKKMKEQPSTSKNNKENKTSGETSMVPPHDRASTETLVLENCYDTAEDVLKDLDDLLQEKEDKKNEKTSLRDLITYSEPLTPMIQDVLHDFTSDDEDELRMQIVEDNDVVPVENVEKNNSHRTISPGVRESPSLAAIKVVDKSKAIKDNDNQHSLCQENTTLEKNNNASPTVADSNVQGNDKNADVLLPNSEKNEKTTQNSSGTITDSILPNNQEGLYKHFTGNLTSNESSTLEFQSIENKKDSQPAKSTRKRSSSQVSAGPKRKLRKDKELPVSELCSASLEKPEIGKQLQMCATETNKDENKKIVNTTRADSGSPKIKDQQNTNDNSETNAARDGLDQRHSKENNSQEAGPSGISNRQKDSLEINPCLKNVSLFAEQFSTSQYSDSETNEKVVTATDETKVHDINAQEKTHEIDKNTYQKPSETNMKLKQEVTKESEINTAKVTSENEGTKDIQPDEKAHQETEESEPTENTDENNEGMKENQVTKQIIKRDINEVVILKSHSESETDLFQPTIQKKNCNGGVVPKSQRNDALGNLFGFTIGTTRKRSFSYRDRTSRRYSQRKRTNSRHSTNVIDLSLNSGSSDYSTESSDSQDFSPTHKNRHHRKHKYIKSKPLDIFSHPELGLCTIHGNKIYPITHHGTNAKRYLIASETVEELPDEQTIQAAPSGEGEETGVYWRLKYLEESRKATEEKIRADELARLLHAKQRHESREEYLSPVLQSKTSLKSPCDRNQPKQSVSNQQMKSNNNDIAHVEAKTECDQKTVKIKFNRNNEIELECQWLQVQPVLAQMAQMFHKNNDAEVEKKPVDLTSGKTTPDVIESGSDVREKVDKLESEIFKEIQERDEAEIEPAQTDANVTRRKRGRPKKSTSISEPALSTRSAMKKIKSLSVGAKEELKDKVAQNNAEETKASSDGKGRNNKSLNVGAKEELKKKVAQDNAEETKSSSDGKGRNTLSVGAKEELKKKVTQDNAVETKAPSDGKGRNKSRVSGVLSDTGVTKRRTRKRFTPDIVETSESPKTRSSSRTSQSKSSVHKLDVVIPDDSQVLYKFPPQAPVTRSASTSRVKLGVSTEQKLSDSYVNMNPRIILSPDSSSMNSIESTQGYQDSDISISNIAGLKKKRKLSMSTMLYRGRRARNTIRKKSQPYLADDDTFEVDPTSSLVNSINVPNSSLDTETYISESYQLLMPSRKKSVRPLDKINETSANPDEVNPPTRHINTISPSSVHINNVQVNFTQINNSNSAKPERNSSNVSLPLSPELSIVENISICQASMTSVDMPTVNETQCNDTSGQETDSNKYLLSDIDIMLPLMEQNCELRKTCSRNNPTYSEKETMKTPVSDSLVNKVSDIKIVEQSISDSLDLQLRNLLLESAKKMAQHKQTEDNENNAVNAMVVDTVTKRLKKTRAKKRCSTPRKKKEILKSKSSNIGPVIEEHKESCSRGGRQSCPPIINIITCEDAASGDTNIDNNNVETDTRKDKRKKDVIKVKILRPRQKSLPMEDRAKRTHSCSRMTVCTDRGINDTESGEFLQGCDESIELIHNHSETCIVAHECIANSVEFVENTSTSIITIDSSSESVNDESHCNCKQCENPDMFCNNAQDATDLLASQNVGDANRRSDGGGTVFHSPRASADSSNSLITEDLSDNTPTQSQSQPKPSKWYILSEDDTNTNFHDALSNDNNRCAYGVGANLNQIFPITCAVPDLSTITEMSVENDSRKALDMDNTENTIKPKSMFDI